MVILTPYPNSPLKTTNTSNKITLPSYPGPIQLTIRINWKDKGEAVYQIDLEIEEKVSYQRLLSQQKDHYGLLIIEPEGTKSSIELPPNLTQKIHIRSSIQGVENAQKEFPELKIISTPSFFLFDEKDVVFKTEEKKELIKYLESITGASYEYILPTQDGNFSVLAVISPSDSWPTEILTKEEFPFIEMIQGFDNLEVAKQHHPDLNIESVPTFFVFDNDGVVFRATSVDSLIQFLSNNLQ